MRESRATITSPPELMKTMGANSMNSLTNFTNSRPRASNNPR